MAKTKAKQAPDKSNDYQEKTLITWTTHPKNKQGIQAKKTSTKKSSFKKKYNVILQGASIKFNYIKRHHQEKR